MTHLRTARTDAVAVTIADILATARASLGKAWNHLCTAEIDVDQALTAASAARTHANDADTAIEEYTHRPDADPSRIQYWCAALDHIYDGAMSVRALSAQIPYDQRGPSGKVRARLTAQDIRDTPARYLRDPLNPTAYDPDAAAEARATRCEHDYRLTDSCPGCVRVEEILEDLDVGMRRAYWTIVAYEAAHRSPQRVSRHIAQALVLYRLVDFYTGPEGTWTAVPAGRTEHIEGFAPNV